MPWMYDTSLPSSPDAVPPPSTLASQIWFSTHLVGKAQAQNSKDLEGPKRDPSYVQGINQILTGVITASSPCLKHRLSWKLLRHSSQTIFITFPLVWVNQENQEYLSSNNSRKTAILPANFRQSGGHPRHAPGIPSKKQTENEDQQAVALVHLDAISLLYFSNEPKFHVSAPCPLLNPIVRAVRLAQSMSVQSS